MDADEAIEKALEPGERVVWADRPHGFAAALTRPHERYAATDRGRLVVVSAAGTRVISLAAVSLSTDARADSEKGSITIRDAGADGEERIVLDDVSYPLIALETLRQVAQGNRLC